MAVKEDDPNIRLIEEYVNHSTWRVSENSNMAYSLQGMNNHIVSDLVKNYWLNVVHDKDVKESHESGEIHISDLGALASYCCGWDLQDLLEEGFRGDPRKVESSPAKHFSVALHQVVNFLYISQGEVAGAVALSNFDTLLAPFIRFDKLPYKDILQKMQEFVYHMNQPSRTGYQSPFSNITLDVVVNDNYKDLPVIIGGKYPWYVDSDGNITEEVTDKIAVYSMFQNEMDMLNKAFCEVMLRGDSKGRIFSFPIPTVNITKDFNWDNKNLDILWELTAKYGTFYFANFVNSDMDPKDIRSMCPLTNDTEVLVRNDKGIKKQTIRDIYTWCNNSPKDNKYEVWTGKSWCHARVNKVDNTKVYDIVMSNGSNVRMGENHLQCTRDYGTLRASDLKVGMWLPFNKSAIDSDRGSYLLGYAIGTYAGDGSKDDDCVIYSLCGFEKDDATEEKLRAFWEGLGFKVTTRVGKRNVRFLWVGGNPYELVKNFIEGKNALEKRLTNRCYNMSMNFKRGFMEGLRDTDGARGCRRLYSSSNGMIKDVATLLSTMGNKYAHRNEDNRENRLGKNTCYRLDFPNKERYGKLFDGDEDFNYYSISSITEVPYIGDLYCFEVENNENIFMLANGLITHNCRLRIRTSELQKRGGGLFGSNPLTGSIGVITTNLSRLGFKNKNNEDGFYKDLDRILDISRRALMSKRLFIEKHTEDGLYPLVKFYLRKVKKSRGSYWANHFNTIGILGMNECCINMFGEGIDSNRGQRFSLEVLTYINENIQRFQEEDGFFYNLEQTPGESTTYRFARKDKELFGNKIFISGEHRSYYTNSTHLPVNFSNDIFDVLDHQEKLTSQYSGGSVVHINLGEKIEDPNMCKKLVKKITDNYSIPYFTISPIFSICPVHGYMSGVHYNCPVEENNEMQ